MFVAASVREHHLPSTDRPPVWEAIKAAIELCKELAEAGSKQEITALLAEAPLFSAETIDDGHDQITLGFYCQHLRNVFILVTADSPPDLIFRDWDIADLGLTERNSGHPMRAVGPSPEASLPREEMKAYVAAAAAARRPWSRDLEQRWLLTGDAWQPL